MCHVPKQAVRNHSNRQRLLKVLMVKLTATCSTLNRRCTLLEMVVDYNCSYFDAIELNSTTSAVVSAMKATFSCHGIPMNFAPTTYLHLVHESSVCFATNMVHNTLL